MYNPIFNDYDAEEYAKQFKQDIGFVKVSWEHDSAVWLVGPDQIKDHEMHYTWPITGQYLPYNILFKNDKPMHPPKPMFYDARTVRTTLS